jgi:hypothetical protein
MTRFVTYDAEVAARIGAAVGMHRVDLRNASEFPGNANPAILDLIRSPHRNAAMMPSSDEQVLLIHVEDEQREKPKPSSRKRKKASKEHEIKEVGSQPSGFLGLGDEAIFADDEEPPRSLWKQDE